MMADNSESLEYEPVTRPRGRSGAAVEEINSDFEKPKGWHRSEFPERVPVSDTRVYENSIKTSLDDPPDSLVFTNEPSTAKPTASKTWQLLKRGHALSYAGVFLFSLMLYFRPYELSPSLLWLSSSAFWIALVTIAVFIPSQFVLEGNLTARPPEVTFVLLLTLMAILSIPFSLSPSTGLTALSDFLKVVFIFIVMVNVVRTDKRLKALLLLTFIASVVVSVAALNDYRTGNLSLQGTRITGTIGGIFSNPNDLALHLVTMTPIALALFLGTGNIFKKLFFGACALIFIVGIVATFSRGGVLGLGVAGFVLVYKYVRRMRMLVIVGMLLLALGAIAVAPGDFRARIFTTGDASAVSRTDDLKRSIFLAVRHPLLGIGFGNYVFYSNNAKATHNAYTQVASEMGLAAAVFYILFLVFPIRSLLRIEKEFRDKRKKPSTYYLAIGLQAALAGYLVSSFFASVPYLWYAYYLVAYAVATRRIHDSTPAVQPQS